MARKMAQPKRRNGYQQRQGPGSGPWLIAGILLALFILGLFYLHSHRKHHEEKLTAKETARVSHKHTQVKAANNKQTATSTSTPQFDFYTMLPDMQVGDSNTASKTTAANVSNNQVKSPQAVHQYILQAGAFKRITDADKVRADLILQGYSVQIKAVQVNNITWQRIIIGPYKTLSEARQAQDKLAKAGKKSLLFQIS